MPHRIAVTGAAGSVGRVTLDGLADENFAVTALTHRDHDDIDSVVLDIVEDVEALEAAFAGVETVFHLAGVPSPEAEWESVLHTNIHGTHNVFEAARAAAVDRVCFASTNHVQHMYNIGEPGHPELTQPDPTPVSPDDPPRPDSYYGVSKLAGEGLARYYSDTYDIDALNLRIGWLLSEDELRSYQEEPPGRARQARVMWLSPRDWRHATRRAASADVEGVHTLNVLSRNSERYFSLTETMRTIGYAPRDDSAEVIGVPSSEKS